MGGVVKKAFIGFALTVASTAPLTAQNANENSASNADTFLRSCTQAKRVLTDGFEALSANDSIAATYCISFIHGFMAGWDAQGALLEAAKQAKYPICKLPSTPQDELAAMVYGSANYAKIDPGAKKSVAYLLTATYLHYFGCNEDAVKRNPFTPVE